MSESAVSGRKGEGIWAREGRRCILLTTFCNATSRQAKKCEPLQPSSL